MPPPFPPEQSVPIGDSPGKSVSPAMLVLQQLHPLRLLFTVFLPYSFSRWASLSDKRLDLSLSSLSFLPRTASLRQPIYIHTCLFFLQLPHLSLTLEPESTRTPHSGEPRLVKTRCVSRGLSNVLSLLIELIRAKGRALSGHRKGQGHSPMRQVKRCSKGSKRPESPFGSFPSYCTRSNSLPVVFLDSRRCCASPACSSGRISAISIRTCPCATRGRVRRAVSATRCGAVWLKKPML
jgi:hypothetical protein